MSAFRSLLVVLALSVGCTTAPVRELAAARTEDLLLRGGIVVADGAAGAKPPTAVAIRDGKILHVGSDAETAAALGANARVIELRGATVRPAFIDAHIHPIDSGVEFAECYLYGVATTDALLDKVRGCMTTSETGWLRGSGWAQTIFAEGPPAENLLDEVETTGPIALMSADGHSYWVNHVALRLAGITAATPDPEDGVIGRFPGSREPNGLLYEGAMDAVEKLIPRRSYADQRRGLLKALSIMHENGIVSFHDAYVKEDHLKVYSGMLARGEISGLVATALYADSKLPPEDQMRAFVELRKRYQTDSLRVSAVKVFLDGTIEDRTAALLKPYLGARGKLGRPTRGKVLWRREKLNRLVELADRSGFQVHFHAIGDGAVRAALDAVERAQKLNRTRDRRHLVAHLQLVDPTDVPRFAKLGVVPIFQPFWAERDEFVRKLAEPVLGPERSKWIYPIGAVARAAAPLAFGSDWAVTSLDPRAGIETAVRRSRIGQLPDDDWTPDQRIDARQAVAAYTVGSAYANFWEGRTGTIRAGMRADLVVLDADPERVPREKIASIRVRATISGGRIVYENR